MCVLSITVRVMMKVLDDHSTLPSTCCGCQAPLLSPTHYLYINGRPYPWRVGIQVRFLAGGQVGISLSTVLCSAGIPTSFCCWYTVSVRLFCPVSQLGDWRGAHPFPPWPGDGLSVPTSPPIVTPEKRPKRRGLP